jgi:hypothetical protein
LNCRATSAQISVSFTDRGLNHLMTAGGLP